MSDMTGNISEILFEPLWVPPRCDTNQAVQAQKRTRSLKILIGIVLSHMQIVGFLMQQHHLIKEKF